MDKTAKVTLWFEDAVRVKLYLKNFDESKDWKTAFYELWRYQMTWDFAYEIKVCEARNDGVYVSMLIRKAYMKNVIDVMEELGYGNLNTDTEHVGIVETYDIDAPEADDMFTIMAE